MSDSQQRTGANGEPSPFDKAEEIFSDLVEQLKDEEFKTLLDKCNEEFVTAEPTAELTDDDFEAIEQAKTTEQLQRKCEYARKLSKAIMKIMSGSPNSELFKTAKKILDLLDEIEAGAENRWRELNTTTYTLVQLCRAKRGEGWALVKKIPRWIYLLVGFLAALLTCIYFLWWLWTTFWKK